MKINEMISSERINDYLMIRMKQYKEKKEKNKFNGFGEEELFSNIMEIVSLMEFTYCTMTLDNMMLLKEIRQKARLNQNFASN